MVGLVEWAAFLTAVASLVAIIVAIVQLSQLRKQRIRDFEDLFVQRYWAIMDSLSLKAIECDAPDDRAVEADDRRAVMAYLRLSEDELELRAERWVSPDTWEQWRAGIASQLRRWPFDVVWEEISMREASRGESGQFAKLRQAGDAAYRPGFDPAPKLPVMRRLGGGR